MGACDEKGEGGKAMAMGIRVAVAGDEERGGDEAGDGVGDEGGVQQRERWLWRQERWQRGWQAIDGNKGDGDGDKEGIHLLQVILLCGCILHRSRHLCTIEVGGPVEKM